MKHFAADRSAKRMLARALLAAFLAGAASDSTADHLSEWPDRDSFASSGEAIVGLHSRELQPISRRLGFRVTEASVKDQQLWVIGELTNVSTTTYSRVRLVIGIEHGAQQRISVGRLAPGTSRRVQARLATDVPHAPSHLRVLLVEATPDYRPEPQRWPRLPNR